jgi:hypothetical protein
LVGLAQHSDVNIVADGIAVGLSTHLGSPSANLQSESTSLSMLSRKFLGTRIAAHKRPLSSKAWGPQLLRRRRVPQRPLHSPLSRPNLRLGLQQAILPRDLRFQGFPRQSSQTGRDTDNSVSRTPALLIVHLGPKTPKTPDTGMVGVLENDQ